MERRVKHEGDIRQDGSNRLLRLFDAISGEFRAVGVRKRPDCPACG